MAGKAELGKAFLDELVSKLSAEQQATVRGVLSSPEAATALEFAGARLSPLDEERGRLEQLQTQLNTTEQRLGEWKTNLTNWKATTETHYTDRERKLAEREAAGGGGGNNGNGGAPAKPADGAAPMTEEQVRKTVIDTLANREGGYIQYVADATRFSAFHLQNFKEVLDVTELVKHPKIGELGVQGVYELLHKEKLDTMRAAAIEADREKWRQEGRQQVRDQQQQHVDIPYPIGEGSPLDVLTLDPAKRPTGDPAAAARMYEQLVAGAATH